jgi:hypothetical protein
VWPSSTLIHAAAVYGDVLCVHRAHGNTISPLWLIRRPSADGTELQLRVPVKYRGEKDPSGGSAVYTCLRIPAVPAGSPTRPPPRTPSPTPSAVAAAGRDGGNSPKASVATAANASLEQPPVAQGCVPATPAGIVFEEHWGLQSGQLFIIAPIVGVLANYGWNNSVISRSWESLQWLCDPAINWVLSSRLAQPGIRWMVQQKKLRGPGCRLARGFCLDSGWAFNPEDAAVFVHERSNAMLLILILLAVVLVIAWACYDSIIIEWQSPPRGGCYCYCFTIRRRQFFQKPDERSATALINDAAIVCGGGGDGDGTEPHQQEQQSGLALVQTSGSGSTDTTDGATAAAAEDGKTLPSRSAGARKAAKVSVDRIAFVLGTSTAQVLCMLAEVGANTSPPF